MARRPLSGLDANLLVLLDALVETASVAEAAKQLGLSASAASHALARLRELVGDPILVRAGRRMVPTARARELAPTLREGLTLVERAIRKPTPFTPAEVERELRIGAIDFATKQIVPPLLDVLRRRAPGVDVTAVQFEPRSIDLLGTGDLDLVLALARPATSVRQALLLREPFASIARRGHPALEERMTAKRFAALPHALVSSTTRRKGVVDAALEAQGLARRVVLVVPTFAAAAIAVAESDMVLTGAAREAELAASHLPLVVFAPPLDLPPFGLAMYWHERQHRDPFVTWVRAELAAIGRALSPGPSRARATSDGDQ